tara:strand:- start:845 stop:1123 length:279 start_codon:yes stop_codon:yes gene_type:complete
MSTDKFFEDLEKCENDEQIKEVFEKHYEDEEERKMMWDMLTTLRDFEDRKMKWKKSGKKLSKDTDFNEDDFMKDMVDVVSEWERQQKKKKKK